MPGGIITGVTYPDDSTGMFASPSGGQQGGGPVATGGSTVNGPGSSGGTGDGGQGTSDSGTIDYSSFFTAFGMPPDMVKAINRLIAQYIGNGMAETDAINNIVGQIRSGQIGGNYKDGMSWYAYTYQGISYGMANGLLDTSNPEASYRDYVNGVNNLYKEYFGRDASTSEILQYMQGGLQLSTVGAQLKGQSYAQAYANADSNAYGYSWNALLGAYGNLPNGEKQLSTNEANAIGESMTGYSTPLGDQLSKQLATATRRLQTIFQGALATPADLQKGASTGPVAPSLGAEVTPDTAPI